MTQELIALLNVAPAPWYMDQDNDSGVCVMDNRGEILFFENFRNIPNEWSIQMRDKFVMRARALARLLIAISPS